MSSSIKIVYLIDIYKTPYAGTERQLLYLIKHLDRTKIEPQLAVLRSSQYIENNDFPCKIENLDIKSILSINAVLSMVKFAYKIRSQNIKVVHIYFNDASIIAPIILKIFGHKVIISRRDMGFWYKLIYVWILRVNHYFIDLTIANCEAVRNVAIQKEWIERNKTRVIYNGYMQEELYDIKSKYKKRGKWVIGIVGNISPLKRVEDLIMAFVKVLTVNPNSELLIIGDGDYSKLQQLAGNLKIRNLVKFLGRKENVIEYIREFDIGILCSETEGCSNSLIEYIYNGVPVACTNTGGNIELIKDGFSGYLIPVGDIDLLAIRINDIISNYRLALERAKNAYDHVKRLCGMQRMIDEHTQLYLNLIK